MYKLTLALDFDKKKTFMSYIKASGELQRELQRLESEFRHALAVELLRIDTMVAEYKKTANDHLAMMKAAGSLDDTEAGELSVRYLNISDGLLQENLSTYELLTGNFKELLTRTLSLFMSELKEAKLV